MLTVVTDNPSEAHLFDEATAAELASVFADFDRPCTLCAPTVGRALHDRGIAATVLDTDLRFADLPGFVRWDLRRPAYLGEEYGVIVCDPPFLGVSLSQLGAAVSMLARWGGVTPLAITYPARREGAIWGALRRYNLWPTGYFPVYRNGAKAGGDGIQFYANFESPLWPNERPERAA